MPAQSKQQQKFMGIVHAIQKGELDPKDASPEARKVAKDMKASDAKDFASTSHKGLPRKVKQEILNRLKEYANKMGTDHLGGDDYTSSKKGGLRDNDGYDNVDYNPNMTERADYKFLTQTILDAKPKHNVYYNSGHNKVNIGGVGYDGGDLVKNFNQKPGSSSKIKNNFYYADQDPQKTKREVEKLSKGKIKVDIKKGYGGKPMAVYIVKESLNEAHYTAVANLGTKKAKENLDSFDELQKFMNKMKSRKAISVQVTKINGSKKQTIDYDWDGRNWVSKGKTGVKEGPLPQNWMSGRTSDYHTKLRGKKREYDDTNFEKDNSGQPDLEESFDKVEHLKLLNIALRTMPGSQKQKEIIRQLNKVRKAGGMRPLKEDLSDVIYQVKKFEKPKDEKLLTIKVINKLKDMRNKSKSSSNKQKLQKMIDKIEGDYKKGKFLTEAPVFHTLNNPRFKKATKDLVKNKKVKNPNTGQDVQLTTALKDKDHPAHNQAKSLFQRLKSKLVGEYASKQTLSFLPLDDEEIKKMNEGTMIRRAVDIAQELLPKDTWSRFASDGKKNAEFVKNIVRDLARSLNQFYKNHNINVRLKEVNESYEDSDFVYLSKKEIEPTIKSVFGDSIKDVKDGRQGTIELVFKDRESLKKLANDKYFEKISKILTKKYKKDIVVYSLQIRSKDTEYIQIGYDK